MSFNSHLMNRSPVRHRSTSSTLRSGSTYNNNSSGNNHHRPRSLGFYHNTNNPYSTANLYNSPTTSLYASTAGVGGNGGGGGGGLSGSYTSNYKSPYFPKTYSRSAGQNKYIDDSRYSKTKNYDTVASCTTGGSSSRNLSTFFTKNGGGIEHKSRHNEYLSRGGTGGGSFKTVRERSMSSHRSLRSARSSGLGSRSISMTSLVSEGYGSESERSNKSNHETSSSSSSATSPKKKNENGEIDYKKLYEEAMLENGTLKDKLRKTEAELRDSKHTIEKITAATRNSLTESDKREKRAMERKLSEMEEELKHLESIQNENQKLKDENGALIRVISKLSK